MAEDKLQRCKTIAGDLHELSRVLVDAYELMIAISNRNVSPSEVNSNLVISQMSSKLEELKELVSAHTKVRKPSEVPATEHEITGNI